MSSDPAIEENQVALKVRGDLGEFQIIEEEIEETESDDDEDSDRSLGTVNALSNLPQDLVKPSAQSVFGSVRVTKSENVQFGNNVYFNGPVTIKQVVHNKEQDNPGYEHTGDDAPNGNTVAPQNSDVKKEEPYIKPIYLQRWLKLTFSAICIVIVGAIFATVSVALIYTDHENTTSTSFSEENSTNCIIKVEGIFLNYRNLKLILITILLVLLTYIVIWCYKLLTKDGCGGDNLTSSMNLDAVTKTGDKYNIEADPLIIAPTHLRIVSRVDWLAQPVEKPLDKIRLPVPWVIIQHTATESCHTQSECVLSVRLIQMFHVESRGWYDIGYNFLVAGDGSAYFGRGWEYAGAHTLGYNKYSMGIAFIGTFNNEPPPKKQLDACKKLIQKGVELGKIAKDYKLFAHRQLASTLSPGDKLFEILKEWPHFVKNITSIDDLIPDY